MKQRAHRDITLSTKELHIGYKLNGGRVNTIHSDITVDLYSGEVTCLLGLNGAGKSTLLRTLCGFQPSLGGEIELLGRKLYSYSQRQISTTIGVVLTEKTNAGGITAYELVSLGRHPHTGFFGELSSADHTIVEESIAAAGIAHKTQSYVSELSDGERQKVMIAKALAQQCPIIILDEPTAFLDVTSRIETMLLLRKLAVEQGKTILLSTHDLDMAIQMGDSLWLQQQGVPLDCGTPEELILNGRLSNFFNKEGIAFDVTTGKITSPSSSDAPIGVEGDIQTSFWVGNALLRAGYKPSKPSAEYPNIICHSHDNLEVHFPDGKQLDLKSVAQLRGIF